MMTNFVRLNPDELNALNGGMVTILPVRPIRPIDTIRPIRPIRPVYYYVW